MGFFSFLVLLGIAYLLWRVTDQLPDVLFRLSEVQRDVAELRRAMADKTEDAAAPAPQTPTADSGTPSDGGDAGS